MSTYTVNVTSTNFEQVIIKQSYQVPVLVDFWAPWCGPCKQVMPILEALAEEYTGRFILAKINTEEQQELANHFQIRSIPSFKVFVDGQVVEEVQGAQPIQAFKTLLEKYMAADESENLRLKAQQQLEANQADKALQTLSQASQINPNNFKIHFDLVAIFVLQNKLDEAKQLFAQLPEDIQKSAEGKILNQKITFAVELENAPALEDIEAELIKTPNNPELLNAKVKICLAKQDYAAAMASLLKLFQVDRGFLDDYARKTLIELFEMLKETDPDLVKSYRRKLQALLF